jgi:hypothetical protein
MPVELFSFLFKKFSFVLLFLQLHMKDFKYITAILICSFLLLQFTGLLHAQATENPFDLHHRLKEKPTHPTEQNKELTGNPFDISKPESITPALPAQPKKIEPSENPFDKNTYPAASAGTPARPAEALPPPAVKKQPQNESTESSGFLFWVVLFMLIFLALELTLFKPLILEVYRAFTNDNILRLLHREQKALIAFPFLLLYLFFFFNFGIFSFLVARFYELVPKTAGMLFYFISGIGILFLLKHILLKLVEIIFPVQKEIKLYSFSLVIFSSILGIALVPFNIVAAFAAESLAKTALYSGLVITFGVTVFCILRGLFLASKYLSFHKFHFFMYLCTVEIAPVIVVIKLLLIRAGIQ